jgi:predicted unusual protein kinase regulating ubiquinone biosynthesis (AarF/ABC1/UbiB family)
MCPTNLSLSLSLSLSLAHRCFKYHVRFFLSTQHPGNVLIMEDGRLGLLDYGMVGRLSQKDRQAVAKTILSVSMRNKAETARIYSENGYKAEFRDGTRADTSVLHRFASFHFDRIDLSPLTLDNGETVDTMELLRSTREKAVPKFVEEGRRLGGLLMGVSAQAARPISLSKEWRPIAERVLREKK